VTTDAAAPDLPALHLTWTVPAARERVFGAWTDPEEIKAWLVPEESEMVSAEVDVRVGGDYRFAFRAPDGELVYIVGTYVEVEPPERLVFTWVFEGVDRTDTLVTVALKESGGGTDVLLTHERLTSEASRALVEYGWPRVLARLAKLLGSHDT
jgi:uncharacterized protein YndB with AHSA1/START domain